MSFFANPTQNPLSYLGVKSPNPPQIIQTTRNPLASDNQFDIGTMWINTSNGAIFELSQIVGGVPTWTATGSGAVGGVVTLTGDAGGPIAPVAGNINTLGTANQITTTGAGNTITWSLPAAITAPGSLTTTTSLTAGTSVAAGTTVTAGTNVVATAGSVSAGTSVTAGTTVTATLGAITATNGNLVLNTAGNKIISTSVGNAAAAGANSFGTVTLVNGTVTVATTAVTANSIIVLTRQSVGATGANPLGELSIGTIVAGVSFDINAWSQANATVLAATDVSSIGWMIIN